MNRLYILYITVVGLLGGFLLGIIYNKHEKMYAASTINCEQYLDEADLVINNFTESSGISSIDHDLRISALLERYKSCKEYDE